MKAGKKRELYELFKSNGIELTSCRQENVGSRRLILFMKFPDTILMSNIRAAVGKTEEMYNMKLQDPIAHLVGGTVLMEVIFKRKAMRLVV